MKLVRYQSWDEVGQLAGHWNALLAASASDTIFLTWEWVEAWWKNYGAGRRLFVLAAWNGDELVGIAPFYVDRVTRWGTDWNCLKLVGDGSGDSGYLDCIVRRGSESEVITTWVDYLERYRKEWDVLEFHGTRWDGPCLAALEARARENSWRLHSAPTPCGTLPLPQRWDDYLRVLKPRFRTNLRACLTFLEQQIRLVPAECREPAQLEDWLPILFDLHTRCCPRKGQSGVCRNPAKQGFYQDVSRAGLKRGWLAFHRLDWATRPLAMQYGFLYRNRFYLLKEGYDPAFESLRPDVILRGQLIRRWIEAGVEEYDFPPGVAPDKMDWGTQQKFCVRITLAPHRNSASVFVDGPGLYEQMRQKVRPVIPKAVLSLRRKWKEARFDRNGKPNPMVVSQDLVKRAAWWCAARVCALTPMGRLGRRLASRYSFVPHPGGPLPFSVRRRIVPIVHIFLYHRINHAPDSFLGALPLSIFRAQMEHVARSFSVVSLDQIARGDFPENRHKYYAAITFDDGYRDNFTHAFPVLREFGIPATIFLITGCIEQSQLPWYDQVSLALNLTTERRLELGGADSSNVSLEGDANRVRAMKMVLEWLWAMPESERLRSMAELFQALQVPAHLNLPNFMLNWDEIRQMAKHGITFGAHTVTHPVLAKLSRPRLEQEILGSKKTIEDRLQLPVRHFSYPFGQRFDFNEEAKRVVQQAGFETAVTTLKGFNSPEDDPFELKRFNPWETDPAIFSFKLDWYRFFGVRQEDRSPSLFVEAGFREG